MMEHMWLIKLTETNSSGKRQLKSMDGIDVCFVCFESLCPSQHFFSHVGIGLRGLNQYQADDKVYCSMIQRSASGEAQTRNPSIPSQALYH